MARVRVYLLYRASARHAQTVADPGLDMEVYPSLSVAEVEIAQRLRGVGGYVPRYVHPDRQKDNEYTVQPDHDDTAHAVVWLSRDLPGGYEPDADSEPHQQWTAGPRGGLVKSAH